MSSEAAHSERAPLLARSSSSSTIGANVKDDVRISHLRGAVIILSVGTLIFLQAVNISMMTTTQSSIAEDLDAFEYVSWFTSAYLIAMSSLAPLMGRLSQIFSPRICMFCSTFFICGGAIATSTATTFEHFVIGRVIAGCGGGGVFIVAVIMVVQMTSPARRGLFMGLANTGMTAGVSLGAVIAGALEPKIGWKPLFGIQAPIAVLCGFGLLWSVPASLSLQTTKSEPTSTREKLSSIDYSGALLLTTSIVLFLFGLSGPKVLLTPLLLSAFALPVFILNEAYVARNPIIPVSVLRSRGTLLSCFATVGFMMARWAILFYTPVYALAVRGWAPAVAGSILIPTNAGFASGGILAGLFHIKRTGSFYSHSVIAMALFPLTMLVLAYISTATSSWELYVSMVFFNGLVTGAALNYALVHVLHLTLPEVHPIVISLLTTFRGFAGSFGSAIGGGYFIRVLDGELHRRFANAGLKHRGELIRRLLGSPALVGKLEGLERMAAVQAYEKAIKALFLGAVGLSIVVLLLQAGTGWTEPRKEQEGAAREETLDSDEQPAAPGDA